MRIPGSVPRMSPRWWNGICLLWLSTVCSVFGSRWHQHRRFDDSVGEHEYDYEYDGDFHPQEHLVRVYERNGCACLLYIGDRLVFRTENATVWHSCSGWGLRRCGRYCDGLLVDDDSMRLRSRQNACDTVGEEVHTGWYLRHQVCGAYGPYEDVLMPEDLCCRRGRPSDTC